MNFVTRLENSIDNYAENQIEWEETNCLLCESLHWKPIWEGQDTSPGSKGWRFAVSQCSGCGLFFTNPRPSPDSMGQFYPSGYRPHKPASDRTRSRWAKRYPSLPRWLVRKHQTLPMQGEGRLLDFGCGGGVFLEQMQRVGWQVTGVDICREAVRHLRENLGINAYVGSLPHPQLESEKFDVITMWHSLEHVHWPRQVLRAAFDLLVPGGKLILAVPNIDSLPFRWFGTSWYGLDLPRHLTHFTPRSLRLMLEESQFQIHCLRMVRHSSWLRMSARQAIQQGQGGAGARLLLLKPASRLVSWYTCWKRQADCIMAVAVKG